jgi:CDP-diacylglycerol--glycerol-3-phosphate 3-phosphatidyltransferase
MPPLGAAAKPHVTAAEIVEAIRRASKAWFEDLSAPLVEWLDARRVTPNQVSTTGLVVTLSSTPFVAEGWLAVGALIFGVGSLSDAVDGALARRQGRSTRFGAFLDSTFDRIGEGAVLAALAVHFAVHREMWAVGATVLSLLGGNLTSYVRARAETLGIDCEVGWVSRTERVFIMGVGMLFHVAVPMIWVLAALTMVTAGQRVWHVYRRMTPT